MSGVSEYQRKLRDLEAMRQSSTAQARLRPRQRMYPSRTEHMNIGIDQSNMMWWALGAVALAGAYWYYTTQMAQPSFYVPPAP
jgi:hypothetical protein